MNTRLEGPELLRTGEVAPLFGVDKKTVMRWADAGKLPSFRLPSGHRRYRRADVEALLQGRESR